MSIDHSPKLIHVQYTEKTALQNAYMSFCKDGGLFIPGNVASHMGTSLNMIVEIPGDSTLHTVSGKVVWINMIKKKGVGVRLSPDEFSRKLKTSIENVLGALAKGSNPTYTM